MKLSSYLMLLGAIALLFPALSSAAVTLSGDCNSYCTINTSQYQASVREGVIEDLFWHSIDNFNWGRDFDDYGLATIYNQTHKLMNQTNPATCSNTSSSSQVFLACSSSFNGNLGFNNWTFFDTYIHVVSTASQPFEVRHGVANPGTTRLTYWWNGTSNKTASSGLTSWYAERGLCGATQGDTSLTQSILAIDWNSTVTKNFSIATNQSVAVVGCHIGRGDPIPAYTPMFSYIKVLEKNSSQSGDQQILQPLNAFEDDPTYGDISASSVAGIYVSQETGSDSNPANSTHPVQTIARALELYNAGDDILLRCEENAIYRLPEEGIKLNDASLDSGTLADPNWIKHYGTCNATNLPKITRSYQMTTDMWTSCGTNRWCHNPHKRIANFMLGTNYVPGAYWSYRVKSTRNPATYLSWPGQWHQNRTTTVSGDFNIVMYSTGNPVTMFNGVDAVLSDNNGTSQGVGNGACFEFFSTNYIYIDGIECMWADGGFNVEADNFRFTNSLIHDIGGGYCTGTTGDTRCGNGGQGWGDADDLYVANNTMWEVFDTPITSQRSSLKLQSYTIRNQIFENNIMFDSGYGYEWMFVYYDSATETNYCSYEATVDTGGIIVRNNLFYGMGYSQSDQQRTNETDQTTRPRMLRQGGVCNIRPGGFTWQDNLMFGTRQYYWNVQGTPRHNGWPANVSMDYNAISYNISATPSDYRYDVNGVYKTSGTTQFARDSANGTTYYNLSQVQASTGLDLHSILIPESASALFIDPENPNPYLRNYTPRLGSSVCGASSDGGDIGPLSCQLPTYTASAPVVYINLSLNNSAFNLTYNHVSFNFTDANSEQATCTLNANGDGVASQSNLNYSTWYTLSFNTTLSTGMKFINVTCFDTNGNSGTSATINVSYNSTGYNASSPVVYINTSLNNTQFNLTYSQVDFNFSDANNEAATCTLYVSGEALTGASGLAYSTWYNFNFTQVLTNGTKEVYVSCVDTNGNSGTSSTLTIRYDNETIGIDTESGTPTGGGGGGTASVPFSVAPLSTGGVNKTGLVDKVQDFLDTHQIAVEREVILASAMILLFLSVIAAGSLLLIARKVRR